LFVEFLNEFFKNLDVKLGMTMHAYNPSPQFGASLGYIVLNQRVGMLYPNFQIVLDKSF
jgi:hypothetical protein